MRIILLKSNRESLKECFVEYVSTYESTILRTFTLGVSSSNYSESCSRFYPLTNLFKEYTFTF